MQTVGHAMTADATTYRQSASGKEEGGEGEGAVGVQEMIANNTVIRHLAEVIHLFVCLSKVYLT